MSQPFRIEVIPHTLRFIQPAGTSRGSMISHKVWYIHLISNSLPRLEGWGECAPLPGLSCDASPDYATRLNAFCRMFEQTGSIDFEALRPYHSLFFGFETAWLHYNQSSITLFDTTFSNGTTGIPINGLIWMGTMAQMEAQIEKKIHQGYTCIKLKIGTLHFEEELCLLKRIRQRFAADTVTLRVDANGAFTPENALERLEKLAALGIHSIEQPIKSGLWQQMAALVSHHTLPIALDEELIGWHSQKEKITLLDTIKPDYLVLKPSLHGGFQGCDAWIQLATERNIGWWATSALESNVGLNAIAQWCATKNTPLHQGLGTGALYLNNLEMPLSLKGDRLWYDSREATSHRISSPPDPRDPQTPFHLNGNTYTWITLQQAHSQGLLPAQECMRELMAFLGQWFDASPTLRFTTSGSTGRPRTFEASKEHIIHSAMLTCYLFKLHKGADCLLCLPLEFIAAKMMVVRALVGGLHLWMKEPTGFPFDNETRHYQFVPLVPMQVYNSLQTPHERDAMEACDTLLIGGGPISPTLEASLAAFKNPAFASYGMAETLSHVALRQVNGLEPSDFFTPLPGVTTSLTQEGCLVIDAPTLCDAPITTNDVATRLPEGRFRILGRLDNLILTGGKKVLAEHIEAALSPIMVGNFAITSEPDAKFGERIVLIAEHPIDLDTIKTDLPHWQIPKRTIIVKQLPLTDTGKIDRKALKHLLSPTN